MYLWEKIHLVDHPGVKAHMLGSRRKRWFQMYKVHHWGRSVWCFLSHFRSQTCSFFGNFMNINFADYFCANACQLWELSAKDLYSWRECGAIRILLVPVASSGHKAVSGLAWHWSLRWTLTSTAPETRTLLAGSCGQFCYFQWQETRGTVWCATSQPQLSSFYFPFKLFK